MASGLPAGVGTGLGSMPGVDPRTSVEIITGELDLGYLPELPARGEGADLLGRMAAVLVDLPMDTGTWGYRLCQRDSQLTRRARDLLARDLDAVEEQWERAGFVGAGKTFKIQVCGPFTFAASVELQNGHKILSDAGAVRDVVASTAEGLADHASRVAARLGAQVVVQLDEPMIGAVIDGSVRPLTRFDSLAPIPVPEVASALTELIAHVDRPAILHDCAHPRWDLIQKLPGVGISIDVTAPDTADLDGIGMLIDRGDHLVAGIVPSTAPDRADRVRADVIASRLAELTDRIGLSRAVLRDNVIVSPTCGLAGAGESWATRATTICAEAGSLLATDPDAL